MNILQKIKSLPIINQLIIDIKHLKIWLTHKNGNNITGRVVGVNIFDNNTPWLSYFINCHFPKTEGKPDIRMISVSGPRFLIKTKKQKKTVFYTAENLHNENHYKKYSDGCIGKVDLSIGFDYLDLPNYCRLPYWITTHFPYNGTENEILNKINELNTAHFAKTKDCAIIARACNNGLRTEIYSELSEILKIEAPSNLFHNTEELKTKYNDNKAEYLKQFRFNICPENSNYPGYVTEKLFDAFASDCIPIYNGSDNQPEPNILNPKAILFWNFKGDNTELIKKIKLLNTNKDAYDEFISQDRFLPTAGEYICEMYTELMKKLSEVCNY